MERLLALLCRSPAGLLLPGSLTAAAPDITVAPLEKLREQMKTSIWATKPDYVVFVPTIAGGEVADASNQHFITFDAPDGALLGSWTQGGAAATEASSITRRTPRWVLCG